MENTSKNELRTSEKTENESWCIKAEESKKIDSVEDGSYKASVVEVSKLELQYGPAIRLSFRIDAGVEKGKVVSGLANFKLTPNTKLYGWIESLKGKGSVVCGSSYNVSTLVGAKATIVVLNEEREFNGEKTQISNVEKVKPQV